MPSHLLGIDNGAALLGIGIIVGLVVLYLGSSGREAHKRARRMAAHHRPAELRTGEPEWHTCSLEWTPEGVMVLTIDGVVHRRETYTPPPPMRMVYQSNRDPSGIEDIPVPIRHPYRLP